jgi:surface protein
MHKTARNLFIYKRQFITYKIKEKKMKKALFSFMLALFLVLAMSCQQTIETKSTEKAITAFSFTADVNSALIADVQGTISGSTIALTVPYGTDVTSLIPTFSITGTAISVSGTAQTSGTTANDFSSPVTYVVTAENGSTQNYTVVVSIHASSAKVITTFTFTAAANSALNTDITGTISGSTIALTVPYGTDVTSLIPTFITTGESLKVGKTAQTSGTTANDFSHPVTYVVTAADGSTQNYTVTVTISSSSAKEITAFSFTAAANSTLKADITGTISGSTIALTVPYGTDLTSLIAKFAITGAALKVGSTTQTSETTANNFTSPVIYIVAAADGSSKNYTVSVTITPPRTTKEITAFSFTAADNSMLKTDITGTISGSTIALTVPYGTNVTSLIPAFTTTGESLKVGGTAQTSGTTANDFSSTVTYVVTAQDGSSKNYTVSVTITPPRTTKEITAFSFTAADNSMLKTDITGTISGSTIALTVPYGTDVTSLIPAFTTTGESLKVGGTAQTSGTTANDFSSTVTYVVTAQDGSSKNYTVSVTILLITKEELIQKIKNNEDVTNIDTSGITDMSQLFFRNSSFNQDISRWDVSNVTDMSYMFCYATTFNQDISNWDVKNVTTMSEMFYHAHAFNKNISKWDVSKVTNMREMFSSAYVFNQDISKWNVSNVTNISEMFSQAFAFNKDISNWDVSKVINMIGVFYCAKAFNQDISKWDVSKVTNMSYMFYRAEAFDKDISGWIVSNVTDMSYMFNEANKFNQDISNWNVGKVRNMSNMFCQAITFNQDISKWDVSNVTDMNLMFKNATSFNKNLSGWDVSNVALMASMFLNATVFNQNISGWNVSKVTNMNSMFSNATAFNQDISGWDVNKVTDMRGTFNNAKSFDQDLSSWSDHVNENVKHADFSYGNCPLTKAHHPYASWADSSDL